MTRGRQVSLVMLTFELLLLSNTRRTVPALPYGSSHVTTPEVAFLIMVYAFAHFILR